MREKSLKTLLQFIGNTFSIKILAINDFGILRYKRQVEKSILLVDCWNVGFVSLNYSSETIDKNNSPFLKR